MTPVDLWPRIEPLLESVERPSRYIDREWGARYPGDAAYRAALVYPDTYEIGQANQAIGILYDILNSADDVAAERAYLPWKDMIALMREHEIPLFSLESCAPLGSFDLIGITVPYELSYSNILEVLDLASLPLRSTDRDESHPLVVGGGPCVYNPEPFAEFFDALLIGEGERAVTDIVEAHRESLRVAEDRSALLDRLAAIPGVYVPSRYQVVTDEDGRYVRTEPVHDAVPAVVVKRVLPDLGEFKPPVDPVVPFMDVVHDRFAVEVLRGCTRGCRFCQAGMVYRPVRERSADTIVRDVLGGLSCTGYNEASLTSLSTADHSQLEEVLRRLTGRLAGSGTSVSLPSLRVDAFSVEMARMISSGKKSGLTFAPEAGTQRMRDVINKNVTEEDLLETVRMAFSAGWRRVKLYFMIGLPTETDDDIRGIGALVAKVLATAREATPPAQRGGLKIGVSVSTFVPKVNTPFQWEAQVDLDEVRRKQAVLRESMPRKGVDLHWHDASVSFLEGVMARGGREISQVIEAAWRGGARFDAWTESFALDRWLEAFKSVGVDPGWIANRQRDLDEPLPWSHLSAGVSLRYLERERRRALEGKTTPDCSFTGCTGCDVCDDLEVGIVLGGRERQ